MDDLVETEPYKYMILNCIRVAGIISIIVGVIELVNIDSAPVYLSLGVMAIFYLLFSTWVVTLPSGASWRPGMAFIFFSILNFDYKLVILVAIPGILLVSWGERGLLKRLLLTAGHLAIGIYAAGLVRSLMRIPFTASILSYIAITLCLFAFFCANRLVSAIIVAIHKQRSILKQIYLIKDDLNWGYSCGYIIGILMYLIYRDYNIPGILLVIVLLVTLFQAFTYFEKLKDMEGKVYIDGLTDAESRTSWEEFLKDKNNSNKSGIVFMMDLDYFKVINDTYGHNFGDQILQEFVSYLKNEMNRKYRLFRYGGDEFILVVYTLEQECVDVTNEVKEILYNQNFIWSQKGLAVAVSFGSANLTGQESIESIVRRADKSMYLNKFHKNTIRSV